MNIKKIIKYILIAVPLLFLAKWGAEKVIYDSNKTPEINPNPKEKLRIYGKFPFENDVNMKIAILYINKNPECDRKIWLAGTQFPRQAKKIFPTDIKNGTFESIITLDGYLPGVCKWEAYNIYAYMQSKKDDMSVNNEGIDGRKQNMTLSWEEIYNKPDMPISWVQATDRESNLIMYYVPPKATRKNEKKVLQQGIRLPGDLQIGTITDKALLRQPPALEVWCAKEKTFINRERLNEVSWTLLRCYHLEKQDNFVNRETYGLMPNVSKSQKNVQINFLDKGWEKPWQK